MYMYKAISNHSHCLTEWCRQLYVSHSFVLLLYRVNVLSLQFNLERRDRCRRDYVLIEEEEVSEAVLSLLNPIIERNQESLSLINRVEVSHVTGHMIGHVTLYMYVLSPHSVSPVFEYLTCLKHLNSLLMNLNL